MTLDRILVAVNAPSGRDAAFQQALALATASGAELYVLHAVPVTQPFSRGGAARMEQMADLRRRADDAGVRVQTIAQHGNAAASIELHAHAREADLIVMGGEARRGWGRHTSAVAEAVVRRSGVPILVVPGDRPASTPFDHVLVAVDLSPASADVLGAAVDLARERARFTVIHAVTGLEAADAVQSPARWSVPEFRAHRLGDARRALDGLVSTVAPGVEARVQVATGSATRTILEHAAESDADLVVVGRSGGARLLGPTALRVLRGNERALLVIPTGPAARRDARTRAA